MDRISSFRTISLALLILLFSSLLMAQASGSGPWIQQEELTGSDSVAGDGFGGGVAIDGETAVIGSYSRNQAEGAAYVFTRLGTVWTQRQILTPADGGHFAFGSSVAISGDTILIGAVTGNAAYVFQRYGNAWVQQQKLTAADSVSGDSFGVSVSLRGDTAVIGSPSNNGEHGAAYVFVRSGKTWSLQQKLTASDGAAGDFFGWSVSLSNNTVLIGADGNDSATGAAYVFTRSGSTWTEQQKLTAPDGAANFSFGRSVALSFGTAVIGSPNWHDQQGSAYVYSLVGSSWNLQKQLIASNGAAKDWFGSSVALDAGHALIGAPFATSSQGSAYMFVYASGLWTQEQEITPADSSSNSASAVFTSLSGETTVIGAPNRTSGGGVAYFVVNPTPAAILTPILGSTLPGPTTTFTWDPGTDVSRYSLYLGKTAGAHDIAYVDAGLAHYVTVYNLPTDGTVVYAQLNSYIQNAWQRSNSDYRASSTLAAAMLTPAPGATLPASTTFTWTAGKSVQQYSLYVGSSRNAHDIAYVNANKAQSASVAIPQTGGTVYVTLYSLVSGTYYPVSYVFIAGGSAAKATMVSPAPGGTISGGSATFQWTSGSGITQYSLYIGSVPGACDLAYVNANANLSTIVSNLPTNGSTIYVTLYSLITGKYQNASYTYNTGP